MCANGCHAQHFKGKPQGIADNQFGLVILDENLGVVAADQYSKTVCTNSLAICFRRGTIEAVLPHENQRLRSIFSVFFERSVRRTWMRFKPSRLSDNGREAPYRWSSYLCRRPANRHDRSEDVLLLWLTIPKWEMPNPTTKRKA